MSTSLPIDLYHHCSLLCQSSTGHGPHNSLGTTSSHLHSLKPINMVKRHTMEKQKTQYRGKKGSKHLLHLRNSPKPGRTTWIRFLFSPQLNGKLKMTGKMCTITESNYLLQLVGIWQNESENKINQTSKLLCKNRWSCEKGCKECQLQHFPFMRPKCLWPKAESYYFPFPTRLAKLKSFVLPSIGKRCGETITFIPC